MKIKNIILPVILVLGFILIAIPDARPLYIVDETEQVVITRFGKVVGETIIEPGLKPKVPFIDKANVFPKNILNWDGEPGQIPTKDKTYIWVDTFARWKIVDAIRFIQAVNNTTTAQVKLSEIIDSSVRNAITSYPLIETVRKSNRTLDTFEVGIDDLKKDQRVIYQIKIGREKITKEIIDQAKPKVAQFGIELVDVKIKRINYVKQVRESVYNRMIAERKQIAEKFRSEGSGEARKIFGEKERDLKQITSEAYKTAQGIKGKADAEATKIYAKAYNVDPEFYAFTKTLEIYSETLGENSSLVLSTDADFLKYLKGFSINK
ncbi:MAG: protease modulator HflC [Desulfobacterales bacterium]|nr:protease modulator HflC [Desulfobacterales bacterium]